MHKTARFLRLLALSICLTFSAGAAPAERPEFAAPKFAGSVSCASSGCHGGGEGKNQVLICAKDAHVQAHAFLSNPRSKRMAESLQIRDAAKSARCNVCHAPMQTLPTERLVKDAKRDNGISCETCHGPSEPWLLFHTRKDVTRSQRIAAGMRELGDLNARATACIACHMNLDPDLVEAGHPEMFFELDGHSAVLPPHWKDEGTWLGPRAWLTGQAVALRELSWKLATAPVAKPAVEAVEGFRIEGVEPPTNLVPRWKATAWLLRKTTVGAQLPAEPDFATMQGAADRLARTAAQQQWDQQSTAALLRTYTVLANDFRDSKAELSELRRRGEVLVLAIDRLWTALKSEARAVSPQVDLAVRTLNGEARAQGSFEPARFGAALEQVEVALELMPKP